MIYSVGLIAVVLIGSVQCNTCKRNGVSCPDYITVAKHKDYEERLYPSLIWVSTTGVAEARSVVVRDMINRIYPYLRGVNSRDEWMKMMVPVRTKKVQDGEFNNYTISIAIATEFQEGPPLPTMPLVTVEREPAKIYFARSFGGIAFSDEEWDSHADLLRKSLSDEEGVDTSYYFWCVYDSPWDPEEDRLNEVWMTKS